MHARQVLNRTTSHILIMHDVQRVSVFEMLVQPQPLTPGFLANRTKDISHAVSAAIHSTLQKAEMLDSEGFLLQDPRCGRLLTEILIIHACLLMSQNLCVLTGILLAKVIVFACLLTRALLLLYCCNMQMLVASLSQFRYSHASGKSVCSQGRTLSANILGTASWLLIVVDITLLLEMFWECQDPAFLTI